MPNTTGHSQVCPTRIDGATALFAHRVTVSQCQDRQRGRYHKCFTCVHNNAFTVVHGRPEPAAKDADESKVKPKTAAAS
jgi:hypothetical protein